MNEVFNVHGFAEMTLRVFMWRNLGSSICWFYWFDEQMQSVFNVLPVGVFF